MKANAPTSYCYETANGDCLFVCPTGTGHVGVVPSGASSATGPRFSLTPGEADELADRLRALAGLIRRGHPGATSQRRVG